MLFLVVFVKFLSNQLKWLNDTKGNVKCKDIKIKCSIFLSLHSMFSMVDIYKVSKERLWENKIRSLYCSLINSLSLFFYLLFIILFDYV